MKPIAHEDHLRKAGARFASYVLSTGTGQISDKTAHAVIADFLPDIPAIQSPIRDMISKPEFQRMVSLAASGRGILERDSILASLGDIYTHNVIEYLNHFLSGFLGLNASNDISRPGGTCTTTSSKSDENKTVNQPGLKNCQGVTADQLAQSLGIDTERLLQFLVNRGIVTTRHQTLNSDQIVEVKNLLKRSSRTGDRWWSEHLERLRSRGVKNYGP